MNANYQQPPPGYQPPPQQGYAQQPPQQQGYAQPQQGAPAAMIPNEFWDMDWANSQGFGNGKLLTYGATGRTRLHLRVEAQRMDVTAKKKEPFIAWDFHVVASDNPADFPVGSKAAHMIKVGRQQLSSPRNVMDTAIALSGKDYTAIVLPNIRAQPPVRGTVAEWCAAHQPLKGVEIIADIEVDMTKGTNGPAHPFPKIVLTAFKGRSLADLEANRAVPPTEDFKSPLVACRALDEYLRIQPHPLYLAQQQQQANQFARPPGGPGGYPQPQQQYGAPGGYQPPPQQMGYAAPAGYLPPAQQGYQPPPVQPQVHQHQPAPAPAPAAAPPPAQQAAPAQAAAAPAPAGAPSPYPGWMPDGKGGWVKDPNAAPF